MGKGLCSGPFPRNIHETRSTRSPRSKARFRSVQAMVQTTNNKKHPKRYRLFCTNQPHFRSREPSGPTSLTMVMRGKQCFNHPLANNPVGTIKNIFFVTDWYLLLLYPFSLHYVCCDFMLWKIKFSFTRNVKCLWYCDWLWMNPITYSWLLCGWFRKSKNRVKILQQCPHRNCGV